MFSVSEGTFPLSLQTTLTQMLKALISNMKSREEEFISKMVLPSLDSFDDAGFAGFDEAGLFNGVYTFEEFSLGAETMARLGEAANGYQQTNQNRPLLLKLIRKLNDECLEKMSIQDLNKKLRRLPKGLRQKFRKRRRILKNRKYALKCRLKGVQRENNIAWENEALALQILQAKEELRKVADERDEYQKKYARLKIVVSARTGQVTDD